MFDAVICPNRQFADRLRIGGVANAETNRLGVEADVFSPALRSPKLRAAVLRSLGLDASAILLVGVGRLAAEKRWDMVLRAIRRTARRRDVGLLLVGDGPKRRKLEALVAPMANSAILPSLSDRGELARLMASADALVHGCEAETFCLVAAEAHASGIPLIVPDRGGAASHLATGAGVAYRAGDLWALEGALDTFIELSHELRTTAAARAANARTMDEHFAELFDRYVTLTPAPVPHMQPDLGGLAPAETQLVPELALARSTVRVR
jgi:alpha-1,6-mannosyltransferase